MSLKSDRVKTGYSELDIFEREEVKKSIKDFDEATTENRKVIREGFCRAVNKASTGPVSSFDCPCCGK